MSKGKLIGIGIGPGDPDLITIKALKVLSKVPVICAPKSSLSKPSLALSIVKQVIHDLEKNHDIIEPLFPMVEDENTLEGYWSDAADLIEKRLNAGLDVAFITLGDPTIFSTFSYVMKIIKARGHVVEIIPGITSFTTCAASAGISLAEKNEILIIIPQIDDRVGSIMKYGDTLVIMKTSRSPEKLEKTINQDQRDKKIISIQNCSMKDEKIKEGLLKKQGYLTTTLIKMVPR